MKTQTIINVALILFIFSCENKFNSASKLLLGKWQYINKDSSYIDEIEFNDSQYFSACSFSDLRQVQSGKYFILNNYNNKYSKTIFFSPDDVILDNDTFNLSWIAWKIKYISLDTLNIMIQDEDENNLPYAENLSKKRYNEYVYTKVKK